MKKLFTILLVFNMLYNFDLNAQSEEPGSDSMYYYLELAAKRNPMVLERYYEYQAALQKVPQAGILPDPQLSMGVFLKPMELVDGNEVADIRLMQMFPWFGLLRSAKDEMSLMANARYELFRQAKLEVFFGIQRTMYELYKTKKEIQISQKNVQILHIIERLTLVKYRTGTPVNVPTGSSMNSSRPELQQRTSVGSSSMESMAASAENASTQFGSGMQNNQMESASERSGLVDLYRIQIEIGDLENNIKTLVNQQSTVQAQLNNYLNRPQQSIVTVMDTLRQDSLSVTLPTISDSMIQNNPMLTMLEFEEKSLVAKKQMVTRMGYPMIGIGVDYTIITKNNMTSSSMNGKDMIMPMVSVTLPIYRMKYAAMQKETELLKSASSQRYAVTLNQLQTDYYEAIQQYQDADRRIKLYANQCGMANQSLNILLKSFATSSSGLTDILRSRQQVLDYEFKQVEAVTDYDTSVARLKLLMAGFKL